MTSDAVDIFDADAIEAFRKKNRMDPEIVRAFRNRLLKRFQDDETALRAVFAVADLQCHSLELYRRCDSEIDGASKLLFRTNVDLLIEAVILRIASGRTTVCISSQVGCAAACDFCATGKMGIAQNLTVSEIVDQVLQAGQILATENRRLQNIVFMGMGEPFHNEANVAEAVELLTSPKMFDRSPASILVSTVGIPDAMVRFAERFPGVNLALSLHSADSAVRNRLIPLGRRHSLDDLKRAVTEINRIRDRPLMIEYLMLAGETDSAKDAERLLRWMEGLSVRVNLIPFNPIDDSPHLKGSTRPTIERFAATIREAGYETTIRYSLGSDIAAACGQLVRAVNQRGVPQATQVALNQKLRKLGNS